MKNFNVARDALGESTRNQRILPALGTNNIAGYKEHRPLTH